jgi:hypothetical protein
MTLALLFSLYVRDISPERLCALCLTNNVHNDVA